MKKKLAIFAVMLSVCMTFAAPAHAGDINAAEQSIIAYYSGTVSYNGKTYQFTEDAKQRAYNKLMADDVNLTATQAAAAIRQANANLDQGISQGYLVEVAADGGQDGTEGTEGAETPNPGNEGSGFDIQDGMLGDGSESDGERDTPERQTYSDAQKADMNSFMQDSLEEGDYAKINAGPSSGGETVATVEQFLKGTVNVVAQNGDVVLSAGLPIKNTGYYTGKINLLQGLAGIACLILIAVFARKKKHYIIAPVLCAAAGIFLVWAFAAGFLESEIGKWSSVFRLGAPEYAYAAEEGGEGISWQPPLLGEQYGEIICEEIGLRAPLYYGDTDEILEKGAGTYAGMNLPGQGGGILISGHDSAVFAPLESARAGMTVLVKTKYGQFEYEVTETEILDVLEYDPQKYGTKTEELALYTCYPFGAEDELRSERFFVYAKKVSGPGIGE